MNTSQFLLESAKTAATALLGAAIAMHAETCHILFSGIEKSILDKLSRQQLYRITEVSILTSIVLLVAFLLLLYIFHRNRSKEYIEHRQLMARKKALQNLTDRGIEFDVHGTLTKTDTGERFCSYCYHNFQELVKLKKIPDKNVYRCPQCGQRG